MITPNLITLLTKKSVHQLQNQCKNYNLVVVGNVFSRGPLLSFFPLPIPC